MRIRSLLRKLAEIRAGRHDLGSSATHTAYDTAFREAGFDFNVLVPADAAQTLDGTPASVRTEIATYLDDWFRCESGLTGHTKRQSNKC